MAPRDNRTRAPCPEGQRPGREHRASVDSNTSDEQCHPRKVFVGGLAHKSTTQHLRDHFGRFGPIVDAVVLRWPDGRSRGFGYVTFGDSNAAASVLQAAPHSLSGREVDVKRAVPGTNKLFVGGLPQNTTANELRDHFETFGVVSDAVVMIDPATSRSRGFGFVCFLPGPEGAEAVTSSLSQYDNHRIRGKWIEVKSAAPPHKLATQAKNGAQEGAVSNSGYEQLSLAGALKPPAALPSPSVENKAPKQPKASKLGSPRKVVLGADLRSPLQSAPPGLSAPQSQGAPDMSPWWGAQPWPQPFAPGFGQLPPFGYPGSEAPNPFGNNYFGFPPCADPVGLYAARSLQQNLEVFLRQSVQNKMDRANATTKGTASPRDASVSSTTCSATTQAEVAQTTSMLI